MKKLKAACAASAVMALALSPIIVAHAQEAVVGQADVTTDATATTTADVTAPEPSADTQADAPADPNQDLNDTLEALRKKAEDPATGPISRFFINIKIREIENKLNIKKAIQ